MKKLFDNCHNFIPQTKNLVDKAERIRWFGIDRKSKQAGIWENDITEVGYKYQMTDISAAMGLASLAEFDEQLKIRKDIFNVYENELYNCERLKIVGSGFKDRFLSITVRCYVNSENTVEALSDLLEDVETVLEDNSRLSYTDRTGATKYTQQITVLSIDTDEGVLAPLGIGEMIIEVRY